MRPSMPGFRGPPRPFEGPPRPPFDIPLRGPQRFPPQRYPNRMGENEPSCESLEGYYEQDCFPEDFQHLPPGIRPRAPLPRAFGPPNSFMGGPPCSRSVMNGCPNGPEIGPPGFGPPRAGYMMPPRTMPPPGVTYPPQSPNAQGISSYDGTISLALTFIVESCLTQTLFRSVWSTNTG